MPEAFLVTQSGFQGLAGLAALEELDLSCWRVRRWPCQVVLVVPVALSLTVGSRQAR